MCDILTGLSWSGDWQPGTLCLFKGNEPQNNSKMQWLKGMPAKTERMQNEMGSTLWAVSRDRVTTRLPTPKKSSKSNQQSIIVPILRAAYLGQDLWLPQFHLPAVDGVILILDGGVQRIHAFLQLYQPGDTHTHCMLLHVHGLCIIPRVMHKYKGTLSAWRHTHTHCILLHVPGLCIITRVMHNNKGYVQVFCITARVMYKYKC